MKKYFLAVLFAASLFIQPALAETKELVYKSYEWEASPKPSKVTDKEKTEQSVVIFDKRIIQYAYDGDGNLQKYFLRHRRVLVNTSESVNSYNKIKIGISPTHELVVFKARAITPSGKVIEVPASSIKEISNEQEGSYKLAAIEGLEAGSEVEYLVVMHDGVDYYDSDYLQSDEPARNIVFELHTPENLKYESKLYNSTATLQDTVIDDQRITTLDMHDVPALEDEKYMFYNANRIRIEYKLAYNTNREGVRVLTWTDAGKHYFETFNTATKDDQKAVQKLLKTMKLNTEDKKEAIRGMEAYLKGNFAVQDAYRIDGETIKSIVSSRLASKMGIMQLYVLLLKQLEIPAEIVITTDRSDYAFDAKFDSWNYLQEIYLYLPDQDLYLAPTYVFCRMGYIPATSTDNDGLFISSLSLGGAETGLATVKHIPLISPEKNYDNMVADVTFNEDMEKAKMHLTRVFSGYEAIGLRGPYYYQAEDKRKEMATSILQLVAADAKVDNIKVNNFDITTPEIEKDFEMEGDLELDDLLENANNKYLMKVGELIGEQTEMYQEKPRQTPVQLDYPHRYHRTLKVHIPAGYTVSGLEALKMNYVHGGSADKPEIKFVSDYTLKDGLLTIEIEEQYNKVFFPLASFEDYREVVNAAANFNKVTLVLTK